jgi:hypothetical protein
MVNHYGARPIKNIFRPPVNGGARLKSATAAHGALFINHSYCYRTNRKSQNARKKAEM